MTKNLTFENVTCSRCGGSGHYSYCPSYGTTCFKCSGVGVVLTKRGAAAQEYFRALCSVPASELQPGVKVWEEPSPFSRGGWFAVESVEPSENGKLTVKTSHFTFGGVTPEQLFRVAHTAEEKAPKVAQAKEYQESLTKLGKPRKQGKKAA